MPKGYAYAEVNITDPEQYEKYRELAPASIASFGGKYLIRCSDPETLEGDRHPKLVVMLEFESRERAKEWYNSIAGAMTMYPLRGSSSSNIQQFVYNAWLQANREAGKTLDFIVDVTRNRASCHRGRRQISGQSASLNSGLQEGGADHGAGNCQ